MALIVQKFGGTSVGTLDRIRHVAKKVIETRAQGHDVVVVVSAMNGETDRLINLAKSIDVRPEPREYAVLVSTGEQVSIALLSMALRSQGCAARSYTGAQAQIRTDSQHQKARILAIEPSLLREDLDAGYTPVIAGFQGVAENGDITTLGRGGSDTTAVALAAALKADECQIYTDVDGIYTADPRVVPNAQRLHEVTFSEMLELSSQGAKVIQQRAVEFAGKYHVPLRVLSTFNDGPGTLVTFTERGAEQTLVTGIATNRNEAKLSVRGIPQYPEVLTEIISKLASEHIDLDMLVQHSNHGGAIDLTFTVSRDEYDKAMHILEAITKDHKGLELVGDLSIAKISLVGVGLRSHPAIIGTLYKILGAQKIPVHLISTTEIKISLIIAEQDVERAVKALHSSYGLDGYMLVEQSA